MRGTDRPLRRLDGWFVALLLMGVLVPACGGDRTTQAPVTSTSLPPETVATVGTEIARAAASVDPGYDWPALTSELQRAWRRAMVAGFEYPLASTVEELASVHTAAIVGRWLRPGPSLELGGDPDNDEVVVVPTIVVRVLDVLVDRSERLTRRPGLEVGDEIVVIVQGAPSPDVAKAPALLFLRRPGDDRYNRRAEPEDVPKVHRDYYLETVARWEAFRSDKWELMTSQSVLVGDDSGTINPLRPPEEDPLAADIAGRPIHEIIERVRATSTD